MHTANNWLQNSLSLSMLFTRGNSFRVWASLIITHTSYLYNFIPHSKWHIRFSCHYSVPDCVFEFRRACRNLHLFLVGGRRGDLHIGSLLCGKNVFRMCTQQNIKNPSNRPSVPPSHSKRGALCPFTIAPLLLASASVGIYIRLKSCKLTPDDNFQDSAPYVSGRHMCKTAQI